MLSPSFFRNVRASVNLKSFPYLTKTMTSVVTEDDKTTEDTQFNLGADFKGKANTT